MSGRILRADEKAIAEAAGVIRAGGVVGIPTETVYGLGADATSDRAVAGIFAAKERPQFNPLICHVSDLQAARELGEFSESAQQLAQKFWPGGLTLVVPRTKDCRASLLVSAGLDTIALRVPAHPIAQALIAQAGVLIAAPSANRSGEVSPTTAQHVADSLGERVELILDGGPARLGLESTVVGFIDGRAALLRPGAIAREAIEAVVGKLESEVADDGRPRSPGRLLRHYAPRRPLRLEARDVGEGEALLAFGSPLRGTFKLSLNLSPTGDVVEAAANLFAHLRALDRPDVTAIAVMAIPSQGLGEAINDRLKRAEAGSRAGTGPG